jgi:hypothetical protein
MWPVKNSIKRPVERSISRPGEEHQKVSGMAAGINIRGSTSSSVKEHLKGRGARRGSGVKQSALFSEQ